MARRCGRSLMLTLASCVACLFVGALLEAEDEEGDDEAAVPAEVQTAAPAANANANPAGNNPAAAAAGAAQPISATTIEDKQFQGPQVELQDGKLVVKADPPQTIPLNELQRITFQHPTQLAVEWVGQEHRDVVQVGALAGPNGVPDVQLRLNGLTAKGLKQVAIVSRPQFRVWRLDAARTPFWRVVVKRIGQASMADLYFEPPNRDLFETELEVTVTFDDNSTAKANVKAAGHTTDAAPPDYAAPTEPRLTTLQLDGGDTLQGRLTGGTADLVTLETAWQAAVEVPVSQIRGILFDGADADTKKKYDEQLAKPGEDDFLLVRAKDGGVTEINGRLQDISESGVKILYEEQDRSIKLERIEGIVLAANPVARKWTGPYQIFRLASGDLLSAEWLSYGEKTLQVKSAAGQAWELPREAVVEITGRNTKMVNLSELTPLAVEQVPYFDRVIPWLKDKSWNNQPLRLDGKSYNRGLAVHSRCVLTYDLGGDFATFRAIVGFDEQAGDRGCVNCRVSVDDQELFAKADFHSTEKPVTVEVPVKGAKQLRLEVDFGKNEDIGDRVIWANARLYRE